MPLFAVTFNYTAIVAADNSAHAYHVATEWESEIASDVTDHEIEVEPVGSVRAAAFYGYKPDSLVYGCEEDTQVQAFFPAQQAASDANEINDLPANNESQQATNQPSQGSRER